MSERDPQDRDPFDQLRDLIDEPVAPRAEFAGELRSRLMREMSASDYSREEQAPPMDTVLSPRPRLAFSIESSRRIKPMVILELVAAAIIVIGLAATLERGWFGNDPETPTGLPAAALQDNGTPVPEVAQEPTMAPAAVPAGNLDGTIWALPGDGTVVNFGGLLVDAGTVYRLIATSSFVGIQAIDAETGAVNWQQAHQWTGNFFALEDGTLYFDGGNTTLVAVDAETGADIWSAQVTGNPIAVTEDGNHVFVLLDSDFVTALDAATGDQLWVAQGPIPQNPTGGSASIPAIGKIAVGDGVVAAVSTYGVLTGFDAANGEELWSHEGFDAATVSISTEDNRFVVSDGGGPESTGGIEVGNVTVAESAMATPAEVGDVTESVPAMGTSGEASESVPVAASSGSSSSGAGCEVIFGGAGAPASVIVSTSGTMQGGAPDGTPGASVTVEGVTGMLFRVQGIDPKTGEIVWAQESTSSPMGGTVQIGNAGAAPAEICAVDVQNGSVSSISVGSSPEASTATMNNGHVVVGSVSSGVFTPAQAGDDVQTVSIGVEAVALAGLDQPVVAIVADENGIYLQFEDGSLVKVDKGQSVGETGQQEVPSTGDMEGTVEPGDN